MFSIGDTVKSFFESPRNKPGPMKIVEMLHDDEAERLGSYPIVCFSESLEIHLDFRPEELYKCI